jgi:hypothetical protein
MQVGGATVLAGHRNAAALDGRHDLHHEPVWVGRWTPAGGLARRAVLAAMEVGGQRRCLRVDGELGLQRRGRDRRESAAQGRGPGRGAVAGAAGDGLEVAVRRLVVVWIVARGDQDPAGVGVAACPDVAVDLEGGLVGVDLLVPGRR